MRRHDGPVSEELAGAGVMANSSSRTGGSLFPTSASENKLRVGRPSGVEATVGGWTAVASRGDGGRTFPTSESVVWGPGAYCSSINGVEQREGVVELGRWTDGMPEKSGSSTGKRAAKSVGAETWAGAGTT